MSQNEAAGGEKPVEVDTGPPPAPIMESLVMSVAHHWHLRETAERQVELIERNFRQDEMLGALRELETMVKLPKAVQKRQAGAGRSASRAQAEDVVSVMRVLSDQDKLPRFLIQSDDLRRVAPLLGAVSVSDERGVAARLEALELSHRQGMEEVKRMVAAVARGTVVPTTPATAPAPLAAALPVIEVTAPATFAAVAAEGLAGAQAAQGRRAQGRAGAQGQEARAQGFFNRGRQEGGLQVHQGKERHERSSSAGKRQRLDDGWQEQRPRRSGGRRQHSQAQVIKGSSEEFAELASPVTFWVGKCRPEIDEDKIKEVIVKCAESCNVKDFVIENVKCLTKEPNPWSKSFKVSVPARFEEAMKNPRMYLGSWEARPFTRWPSGSQQGPPAPQQQGPPAPQQQGPPAPQQKGPMGPQQQGLLADAAIMAAGGAPQA